MLMNDDSRTRLDGLVNRFLAWKLPDSVCSDQCATQRGYPHRTGTTLLTADEARQMLEHVLQGTTPPSATRRSKIIEDALTEFPQGNDISGIYTEWKKRLEDYLASTDDTTKEKP